ncbi:MAG: rhomboid family intramembrane serine protease [Pasteurellaceae bacterium]|nr:rhomboid family intramembrane serine protease [Pasteurellaceae bacterium]
MFKLMESEIGSLCVSFRDYIRQKYKLELVLKNDPISANVAVYIDENSPFVEQIKQEVRNFVADPFNEKYQQASWQTGNVLTQSGLGTQIKQTALSVKNAFLHSGKLTLFLTAVCVIVYLCQILGFQDRIFEFAHYPDSVAENTQYWRYLSHTLVHLSLWHLLFNVVWWWIFAGAIERQFGTHRLLLIYLSAGVISGIVQNAFSGPAFFGLSGVVYAVLGFVFVVDKFSKQTHFDLPAGFFSMLVVGVLLGFVSPWLVGVEMGNAAHIAGLMLGLIFGVVQVKWLQ